jgi:uncharacterized cupin superfamily protein
VNERVNVYSEDWDVERSPRGMQERYLFALRRAGGEKLGGTIFEVEPGWTSYYHLHHGNEEMVLVLDGSPTLRTADGERELRPGDVAFFRRGLDGAHALENRSEGPVRFIVFSTMVSPDIAEQTETGVVGVYAGDSPTAGRDAPLELQFRRDSAVGYFDALSDEPS